MSRDDDIDDQVHADLEFTRRAEKLISRLRTQGKARPAAEEKPENPEPPDEPEQK